MKGVGGVGVLGAVMNNPRAAEKKAGWRFYLIRWRRRRLFRDVSRRRRRGSSSQGVKRPNNSFPPSGDPCCLSNLYEFQLHVLQAAIIPMGKSILHLVSASASSFHLIDSLNARN